MSSTRNKLQQMWKKGQYAKVCRQKYTNNRTVERLIEKESDDRDETSSESEESIHNIE